MENLPSHSISALTRTEQLCQESAARIINAARLVVEQVIQSDLPETKKEELLKHFFSSVNRGIHPESLKDFSFGNEGKGSYLHRYGQDARGPGAVAVAMRLDEAEQQTELVRYDLRRIVERTVQQLPMVQCDLKEGQAIARMTNAFVRRHGFIFQLSDDERVGWLTFVAKDKYLDFVLNTSGRANRTSITIKSFASLKLADWYPAELGTAKKGKG